MSIFLQFPIVAQKGFGVKLTTCALSLDGMRDLHLGPYLVMGTMGELGKSEPNTTEIPKKSPHGGQRAGGRMVENSWHYDTIRCEKRIRRESRPQHLD